MNQGCQLVYVNKAGYIFIYSMINDLREVLVLLQIHGKIVKVIFIIQGNER